MLVLLKLHFVCFVFCASCLFLMLKCLFVLPVYLFWVFDLFINWDFLIGGTESNCTAVKTLHTCNVTWWIDLFIYWLNLNFEGIWKMDMSVCFYVCLCVPFFKFVVHTHLDQHISYSTQSCLHIHSCMICCMTNCMIHQTNTINNCMYGLGRETFFGKKNCIFHFIFFDVTFYMRIIRGVPGYFSHRFGCIYFMQVSTWCLDPPSSSNHFFLTPIWTNLVKKIQGQSSLRYYTLFPLYHHSKE